MLNKLVVVQESDTTMLNLYSKVCAQKHFSSISLMMSISRVNDRSLLHSQ